MSLDINVDTGGAMPHTVTLYAANITHNLTKTASVAGVCDYLWRAPKPDNLRVLCLSCHMSLHKTAYWAALREGKEPPKSTAPHHWEDKE